MFIWILFIVGAIFVLEYKNSEAQFIVYQIIYSFIINRLGIISYIWL